METETVDAGDLRHYQVTFQDPIEEQDATSGDVVVTGWTDTFVNVSAGIAWGSGRESLYGAQLASVMTAAIVVRWRPGIHAKQRIVCTTSEGRRIFNIAGYLPNRGSGRTFVTIPVTGGEFDVE